MSSPHRHTEHAAKKSNHPAKTPIIDGDLDEVEENQLKELGFTTEAKDPNFQSELNYDGYQSIEEYDNNTYRSTAIEREADSIEDELDLEGREEGDSDEENPVDPQENSKA
jgi:hypothetical protein